MEIQHDVGLEPIARFSFWWCAQTGISTRAFVGGGTTFVGLSTTPGDKEFVSFFVHYNGGTNTDANSYDIFVTKNGQFRPSAVGV